MRIRKHKIIFNKERYSSYDVEKIMLDFGSLMWNRALNRKEINVSFEHKGMVSKKQDYIN